ncbi:hypothetical protein LEP1GSC061_0587 [Leptospira wolffii serovar Khorat str. Khorat-H2]|nr:hypothetical protein LEP1GSC061_0587 [Leptospira wolffii serovar Khorat str. Khorat-H2]
MNKELCSIIENSSTGGYYRESHGRDRSLRKEFLLLKKK